jgi:RNA polymerase sigma factor (sigma-70 family)
MSLPPFQELLDQHAPEVYGFLVAALGRQEAEDCFQETFMSALRGYPRLRHSSNLRAWLFSIAHRKLIDAHRARQRRPRPIPTAPESSFEPADHDPGLWKAVRDLPPKQRTAVLYRFVVDLPYRDIGRITGSSEEAARQNVSAGLKKLREVYGP